MKQCPYCGSELPDDQSAVYCINCDHIIDDDFILRQKIKKELEKPRSPKMRARTKKNRTQPPVSNSRRGKDDYVPKMHYEEEKSYANIILVAVVVIILLYITFK